jgi:hypothetical protein
VDEREPKGRAEMLGDTFREAAVLFLVFIPLDLGLGLAEDRLSLSRFQIIVILIAGIIGSAFLEWFGMVLERRR